MDKKTYKQAISNEFEETSRTIRWFIIIVVLLTFPFSYEQIYLVYAIAAVAIIYNALRYVPFFLRSNFFASPMTVIGIDTLFICTLVAIAGTLSTPYSAFLFLMIVAAAYCYQLIGVAVVAFVQILLIYLATVYVPLAVIDLDISRLMILSISAMLAIGYLVVGLTRNDKNERDTLRQLAKDNDTERSRLTALINTLRSAIFVVDHNGHIILHNDTASTICDVAGNMKGQRLNDVLPLYVRTDPDKNTIDIINDGGETQHRRDLRFGTNESQMMDLDVTVAPVQLQHSRTVNYMVICEDITHELSLSDQQTEFISVASHELRTPIAIMEAALSTVLHVKETLPQNIVPVIEQAHNNSLLLSGIVKDLAVLREAKNDNIPVQLESIDSTKLTNNIGDDFQQQITQKGLKLERQIDTNLPEVLSTERHIREILQNYMTNAIKYSNEGTVTLSATATKAGGVIFSVKDTGIGMSPNDVKNLFHKFYRAADYRTQQVGGTGLGLYLCKGLAERLGGKVWCESVLNKGSTFFLEIPPFSGLRRDQSEVVKAEVSNLLEDI